MHLLQELRQAIRALAGQPGLALLSIAALGIGIGLPTAMFSLVQASLLRGLPFEEANRIYHLERRRVGEGGEGRGAHARDIVEWRNRQKSFEQLAAYNSGSVILRGGSSSERYPAAYVTPELFAALRVRAAHGRAFTGDDGRAGGPPVALLGYEVWRDRFAGDRNVVGQAVYVDGNPHTVLGIMPERFRFPDESQVWLPVNVDAGAAANPETQSFGVIGRLRPDVSAQQARAEFAVIGQQVASQYPQYNKEIEVAVKRLPERLFGEVASQTMYVMLGAVLLVLLVACINVANLLLVRAVYRVREFAIRAALGAGRARIIRQLFLEAFVLAVLGGALGVVVATGASKLMAQGTGGRLPSWVELRIDPAVLGFALLLTAISAVIAAVLPALKSTRGDLAPTLYDASRGSTGLRVGRVMRGLIIAEIAFSFALVALTGLMVRGVGNVQKVPLVFDPERVFTAEVSLPDRYDRSARLQYFEALQRDLASAANARAVALASSVPAARGELFNFTQEGKTYTSQDTRPVTRVVYVTPEFFPLFDARAQSGRLFGPQDHADSEPVVIVNARFAERFLDNKDPLGQRIRFGNDETWRTIVGVVPNLWVGGLDAPVTDRNPAGVYLPVAQSAPQSLMIIARTKNPTPLDLSETVRTSAFRLDPDVPVDRVRTMPQVVEDSSWFYGWGASIMGICGLSALLLATIGLFGVVAFSVGRRVREFGIRLAVGATPGNVIRLVLRQSAAQIILGLVLGLALALLLGRGVSSLMFLVQPNDPVVITAVALLLTSIALFAAYAPARRAARIDPLTALREE